MSAINRQTIRPPPPLNPRGPNQRIILAWGCIEAKKTNITNAPTTTSKAVAADASGAADGAGMSSPPLLGASTFARPSSILRARPLGSGGPTANNAFLDFKQMVSDETKVYDRELVANVVWPELPRNSLDKEKFYEDCKLIFNEYDETALILLLQWLLKII